MKRSAIFLFFILFSLLSHVYAQNSGDTLRNGYVTFRYPSGQVSSEGTMRDGKPDGYWKTYYENGLLKAEGNRKEYQLEGLWKFYDDSAKLIASIEYRNGFKNGLKTTYRPGETLTETFVNDIKEGPSTYFYPDGKVRLVINFVDGLETGFAKEYAPDGTVITLYEYRKGFMVSRERINRKDSKGLKQGKWKYFYPSGNVKTDGVFRDDKKYGYFKEYDEEGQLVSVKKFVNDVEQVEAPELTSLSLKTDYYPNGKVKTVGSYNGEIPEGVRREFSEEGKITAGYVFRNGVITGEGIIDEEGIKDGPWKEYYENGQLRSQGTWDKGKQVGAWKYFYDDGKTEQEGKYNKQGKLDGTWRWYYENGTLRREQSFIAGLEDGEYTEYEENGRLIVKGSFVEGLEEGQWMYDFGDYKEQGSYAAGNRNGKWKSWFADGTPRFEGEYIDDNLNGKAIWYWPNGKKKDEGNFVNGSRQGNWISYSEEGLPFLTILYKNDIEVRYDGVVIKPPFKE